MHTDSNGTSEYRDNSSYSLYRAADDVLFDLSMLLAAAITAYSSSLSVPCPRFLCLFSMP
jgi:hypothetical protein